ncbi:MAG: serine/threonine-protein kinase, partial [Coriobacteriia bacterium]|nr:serine/threonine-protein kinase [Coriobacteriia bacterium]
MEQPLILDRYRPLAELASGGFGQVMLAYDTRMQRRVAIKRLPVAEGPGITAATTAGLAEARTAAMLNHANIVTVHEWDTDADEAFLIMEYIDGASVADILDARGPLNRDETAAVIEGCVAALVYAHENGVLHLDIKPENVLVTRDGRVKVADFGIAALSSATGHGPAAGGTLGYMPLEQLREHKVDERTDVWALAALTFELLTDANPFSAHSIEASIFKVDVLELPLASEFDGSLPRALDNILVAALAPNAQDRYPSVAAFASAIMPHLGDSTYGHEYLAEYLESEFPTEFDDNIVDWDRIGLWDRMPRLGKLIAPLMGAVVGGWLAFFGLSAVSVDRTPALAATGLVALAGILAPGLGSLLGRVLFLG